MLKKKIFVFKLKFSFEYLLVLVFKLKQLFMKIINPIFLRSVVFNCCLFIILLVVNSCSSSPDINKTSDSTTNANKPSDSTLPSSKVDTTHLLSTGTLVLDSLTCAQVENIFDSIKDPREVSFYMGRYFQCIDKEWNDSLPNDPVVTIVSEVKDDSTGNKKILFNTVSAKLVDNAAKLSKMLITIGAFAESDGDPNITAVATVTGNYAVDAYVDAAKTNDPLIIIMPELVPPKKLTMDTYKLITKVDIHKPYAIAVGGTTKAVTSIVVPILKEGANTAPSIATAPIYVPKIIVKEILHVFGKKKKK